MPTSKLTAAQLLGVSQAFYEDLRGATTNLGEAFTVQQIVNTLLQAALATEGQPQAQQAND